MLRLAGLPAAAFAPPSLSNDDLRDLHRGRFDGDLSVDDMHALAASRAARDRAGVAALPECPIDLLEELAFDSDVNVLGAVANNPRSTRRAIDRVISGTSSGSAARLNALCHPAAPIEAVDRAVRRSLEKSQYAGGKDDRDALLAHARISGDLFRELMKDSNETVSLTVLRNPHMPEDALRVVARSRRVISRALVASNVSTPPDVLVGLLRDEGVIKTRNRAIDQAGIRSATVAAAATGNPSTSAEAIIEHFRNAPRVDIVTEEMARVAAQRADASDEMVGLADRASNSALRRANPDVKVRLCARTGVSSSNREAIEMLISQDWWTFGPESDEVAVVTAMHPDR